MLVGADQGARTFVQVNVTNFSLSHINNKSILFLMPVIVRKYDVFLEDVSNLC